MIHQALTLNHRLESWVFANAAARGSATPPGGGTYVAGDLGRIGYQTDNGTYWRLTGTGPAWQVVVGAYASVQTAQISPASTTAVNPGIMLGLGSGAHLTPIATGKVLVTAAGTVFNAVAGAKPVVQLRYGSPTAPTYGLVGTTGTQIGALASVTGNVVNNGAPFSLTGLITGAVPGTNLWFDLQLYTDAGGTADVLGATISAVELP